MYVEEIVFYFPDLPALLQHVSVAEADQSDPGANLEAVTLVLRGDKLFKIQSICRCVVTALL